MKTPHIVVIVGPTSSGKSNLGVEMAIKRNGEVISADSRQVYKGMNIGTGKISKKEMKGISHHMLDMVLPKTDYNVSKFKKDATKVLEDILKRGKLPIIVGGAGFWIDALVYDLDLPDVEPDKKLRLRLEKLSTEQLYKQLQKMDPRRASDIDRHNKRRLVRAIEILEHTGHPVKQVKMRSMYDIEWIGITVDKDQLERKIRKRFIRWLDEGFIQEVDDLHKRGVSWKRFDELGMNYRAAARLLQKKIDYTQMIHESVQSITQYSKRQMTWFKRNRKIEWRKI